MQCNNNKIPMQARSAPPGSSRARSAPLICGGSLKPACKIEVIYQRISSPHTKFEVTSPKKATPIRSKDRAGGRGAHPCTAGGGACCAWERCPHYSAQLYRLNNISKNLRYLYEKPAHNIRKCGSPVYSRRRSLLCVVAPIISHNFTVLFV